MAWCKSCNHFAVQILPGEEFFYAKIFQIWLFCFASDTRANFFHASDLGKTPPVCYDKDDNLLGYSLTPLEANTWVFRQEGSLAVCIIKDKNCI